MCFLFRCTVSPSGPAGTLCLSDCTIFCLISFRHSSNTFTPLLSYSCLDCNWCNVQCKFFFFFFLTYSTCKWSAMYSSHIALLICHCFKPALFSTDSPGGFSVAPEFWTLMNLCFCCWHCLSWSNTLKSDEVKKINLIADNLNSCFGCTESFHETFILVVFQTCVTQNWEALLNFSQILHLLGKNLDHTSRSNRFIQENCDFWCQNSYMLHHFFMSVISGGKVKLCIVIFF